jgi:capsular polysaccharide biosynthesis protein
MSNSLPNTMDASVPWRTYGMVVRDRWRLLAACAALGAMLAGGYLLVTGKTSTATADVNVTAISTDPFSSSRNAAGLLDATTESKIATSQAVAKAAAGEVPGGMTPSELRAGVSAELVSDATVMRISYSHADPAIARSGADAISVAYLDYRQSMAQKRLDTMYEDLDARLTELRDDLADINARSADAVSGSPEAKQAESDRSLVTGEINSLLGSKNALDKVDTSGGSVLNTAEDNAIRTSPNQPMILLTGLFAGLGVGIVAAFAIRLIGSRRVRVASDLEQLTGGVLATVAMGGTNSRETYRYVRERLLAAFPAKAKVIALVDGTGGAQSDDLPAELAQAFDEIGRSTTVLRADGQLAVSKSAMLDTKKPGSLVLLVVPVDVELSAVLVAGRLADAAVFLVEPGVTRASTLASFRREFDAAGLPVLGSVKVPRTAVAVRAPMPALGAVVAEQAR